MALLDFFLRLEQFKSTSSQKKLKSCSFWSNFLRFLCVIVAYERLLLLDLSLAQFSYGQEYTQLTRQTATSTSLACSSGWCT